MDVFISWSGKHSRDVALAFAEWLPAVLQRVRPFVSDKDIHSGARWQAEITSRLETCAFGVLIVTADNQTSPWLQFEAGALSKSVNDARVVPLLVDLKKSDLLLPLNMFQAETLDEAGVTSLLSSMNSNTEEPLPEATVTALAAKWWPDLGTAIASIKREPHASATTPERTERELLEELVTMVRSLRNASPQLASDDALQALRAKLTSGPTEPPSRVERIDDLERMLALAQVAHNVNLDLAVPADERDNALTVVCRGNLPSSTQRELQRSAVNRGFSLSFVESS